jgi:hypothetical protein
MAATATAAPPTPGNGIGGDTESGVKVWQSRLVAKLNGVSPAAVVIQGESQDGPQTLQLIVSDYVAAGAAEEAE